MKLDRSKLEKAQFKIFPRNSNQNSLRYFILFALNLLGIFIAIYCSFWLKITGIFYLIVVIIAVFEIVVLKREYCTIKEVKPWDMGNVGYEVGMEIAIPRYEHCIIDGNVKVWNYLDINNQEVEYYLEPGAKEEHDFKDDEQTGVSRLYYENGQIKREIEFKKGKADGVCVEFYETGEPLTKESYKDGKLHGISWSYYKNGGIESERYYEGGIIVRQSKTYYENGLLKSVTNYMNGVLQGISRTYYPNGMLEMEKNYERGKVVSKHRFYRHKYKFIENNIERNVGEEK